MDNSDDDTLWSENVTTERPTSKRLSPNVDLQFSPVSYATDSSSLSSYETASIREFRNFTMIPREVLKAGGLGIAAKDIKSILRDLKSYVNTQITDLPEHASHKFDRLSIYSQTLYDTDEYDIFYSWVQDQYGHLKKVYPGTVGSFMSGCMVSNSFDDDYAGCAICCAASIPRPRSDHSFRQCDNTVIKGNFDGKRYHFAIFKRADSEENHRNAYLYVNSGDADAYPGFSPGEKRQLRKLGLEKVKVYGFNSDGRNYVEITSSLVKINRLKSRNRHHSEYRRRKEKSSNSSFFWIILIIVIIILIAGAMLCYRHKSFTSTNEIDHSMMEPVSSPMTPLSKLV